MINFSYKRIACVPPAVDENKPTVNNRVLNYSRQKLVGLKVVFASGNYVPGDTVYVQGDSIMHFKNVFHMDGVDFVLVSEDLLIAADLVERPKHYGSYWSNGVTLLTNAGGNGSSATLNPYDPLEAPSKL